MCVPSPQDSAAPASTVPSIQSATSLNLADDAGRGAANLGRLQLRVLGNPSAPISPANPAPTSQSSANSSATNTPSATSSGTTTAGAPQVASPYGAGSPNMGLRLGAQQ